VRDPASGTLRIEEDVAEGDPRVVVHDAHNEDPSYAFAISRLSQADSRLSPMGVFRDVTRPSYDRLLNDQLQAAKAKSGMESFDDDELQALLRGTDAWTIA
jgi:2-oxoglutarate ferredoxin oxidoreductase subunit beta